MLAVLLQFKMRLEGLDQSDKHLVGSETRSTALGN